MSEDDNNKWFDVLTGREKPQNREEKIFSELRDRVIRDAESDEYKLSELDLQRGKRALRSASKSNKRGSTQPFLSGLAAGVVAAGFGMSVFLSQVGDPEQPVTKGLPDGLSPSVVEEWPSPGALTASLPELVEVLSAEAVAFDLEFDGAQLMLSFKTPAPVPDTIGSWLQSNGLEALPATVYRLRVATENAR